MTFSETMVLKIVMDVANCGVGSFSNLTHLVNEIVHLPGKASHITPKIPHLCGVLKYIGPGCIGLLGI